MPSSSGGWRRDHRSYLLTLTALGLALWAELAMHRATDRFTFVAFAPAVAIAAWSGGFVHAMVAIAASIIASDYFLLGPERLLHVDDVVEAVALGSFAIGWTAVAALARSLSRQVRDEVAARRRAERTASQSHRLAQTTAALGQARMPLEAIEAALQEPLHWLKAEAGVFLLLSDDGAQVTVARAVGHSVRSGDAWPLEAFGQHSPFSEAMRRLAPVVITSKLSRKLEYAEWAAKGPWRDYEASLVLPIALERRVVAFLQLDFGAPGDFTVDDHEYVHVLCSRVAQALDRTWSYEAVERARADAEGLKARADAELLERQKTEQALRASETRYRALATRTTRLHALTASLSEAVSVTAVVQAVVEQARIVVGANEGDLHLIGDDKSRFDAGSCAAEALKIGKPVFVGSLVHAHEKFWQSAALAADNGFSSAAALPLLVDNTAIGVLEFHFSAPVNFDVEYSALLISVAQHCTQALDRARLYEQAQRARAEAEAANRLKDEFVSTVSHELRTPLNAILGWASMLRNGSMASDVVPQALESVYRNASRQARLVDDLLDFARIAGGRTAMDLEAIDAPNLLRGVIESIAPLAVGSQVEITLSAIPPSVIRGDARRLEQVFVNLLGNSLKFTPAGGHIMVSARIAGRDLEVRVADDGIGIEPEFLPFVFDRFRQGDSTTTRHHSGLGLGLSIAKQLVEAHNGAIRVESAGTNKGTAFIVTLPLEGNAAVVPDEAPPPAVEPRLDGVRVLVVDDEKDARDLIGRALEDRGAEITVAANSHDAMDILERSEIDVLLADIAMPDEDGYALIRRIRSSSTTTFCEIPAAAVTAHARHDERRRALDAGFHAHVAKPVEPLTLVRTVDQLMQDRRAAKASRV
jgi:signal transduction histidine kinase/ActR/RegA family two-component response regulator